MSVDELLANAREEVRKVYENVEKEKLDKAVLCAVIYADKATKLLIAHTLNVGVSELFDEYEEPGYITMNYESKKYKLQLDLVDKEYIFDDTKFNHDRNFVMVVDFLINMIRVIYVPLKETLQKRMVFEYDLVHENTVYLDVNCQKRIGIVITTC